MDVPVVVESPSAHAHPHAVAQRGAALVVWCPDRGWRCSVVGHGDQPCEHTDGLDPVKHPMWRQ
mgnify:CR=1 FL=1